MAFPSPGSSDLTDNPTLPLSPIGIAALAFPTHRVVADGTLDAFTSIDNCTPFSIGVQVGSGDASYTFAGNQDLAQYLTVAVKDGVLSISATGLPSGEAVSPIAVIVSAPSSTSLSSISASGQGGVSVLPGLATSESMTISSSGQGSITGLFDVTEELTISSSGQGKIDVGGEIGSLAITSSGQGAVDVFGVQGDAKVDMSGQGNVFISGSSGLSITGSNDGMGQLKYDGEGSCTVPNSFFATNCVKSSGQSAPEPKLPNPSGTSVYSGSYEC